MWGLNSFHSLFYVFIYLFFSPCQCYTVRNNLSESILASKRDSLEGLGKASAGRNKPCGIKKHLRAREVVKLLWAMTAVTFWNLLCQLQSLLLFPAAELIKSKVKVMGHSCHHNRCLRGKQVVSFSATNAIKFNLAIAPLDKSYFIVLSFIFLTACMKIFSMNPGKLAHTGLANMLHFYNIPTKLMQQIKGNI